MEASLRMMGKSPQKQHPSDPWNQCSQCFIHLYLQCGAVPRLSEQADQILQSHGDRPRGNRGRSHAIGPVYAHRKSGLMPPSLSDPGERRKVPTSLDLDTEARNPQDVVTGATGPGIGGERPPVHGEEGGNRPLSFPSTLASMG